MTQTGANARNGAFSPDGKWVAYDSDESGSQEIYVQALLRSGHGAGKWQVSKGGAQYPRWRGDGRELFYFANGLSGMMAVSVTPGSQFDAGTPRSLFQGRVHAGITPTFAVTADGRRFIIAAPMPADTTTPVTVVLNWTAALKK